MRDIAWMAHAACRGRTEWFYPTDATTPRQALDLCAGCPVRHPCRTYALVAGEELGVWGGLTPSQREDVTRRRAVSA